MDYNKIIKELINEPLSSSDILQKLDYKTNLIKYGDLAHYNNIDDVLGKYGACIILYELKNNFGHWTLLFKRNNNIIEHFDSLGYAIDDELQFINLYFRKISNQLIPHLSYLLYISPYKCEYNDFPLQEDCKNVATCGKWCVLRLLCRNLNINKFIKLFDNIYPYTRDEYVTLITHFL